jgi:ferrous iron transport protein B
MKLSELSSGEKGIIVKVMGHGGFRKRIIEMGFVKGKTVEVLLNAPLQDPVKYKVMGYEVSLRRQEAEQIEVINDQQARDSNTEILDKDTVYEDLREAHHEALRMRRHLNVALVGNPNCGKTSLFNFASGAHAHVGNYSGVTIDATEAKAEMYGYEFTLTDLPGTYSLSCYSPEELYVRKHLSEQMPDVVINVIDASNLERNLYLTTQLVDMNVRMVCALNMFDEFERRGDQLDIDVLSRLFGVPMVPTSFKTGMGVKELFKTVIQVYEGKTGPSRHIHINYGHELENGIVEIQSYLKADEHIRQRYSTRYLAIKLLEHDSDVLQYVGNHLVGESKNDHRRQLLAARDKADTRIKEETGTDAETAITDAKYGFINGALTEARFRTGEKEDTYRTTHLIDRVMSNRIVGLPIFFFILFVMFQTTFVLGQYPMDWIDQLVEWTGDWVGQTMTEGPLQSMLVDGVIGGVGAVIVFLPQILILYFFISLMEDSGYMARAAFIMDRLMHVMGLHGKSFIPLIMGFGCNVPAVMATRTIESRRSRIITMMIIPLMSCSARLPIYIMIVGTFFAVEYQSWVMLSLYAIGIVVAVIMSKLFSRFLIKGEDTPFVMELPPYRWPTTKAIGRHTWEKGKEYLKKMGGIILVASIIVWALGYFGPQGVATDMPHSFIGSLGRFVEPLFSLQGFNWQMDVSLIAGVGAKEIVASTIGILGGLESVTPLAAYSYLLFVLIYFPCIATVVAVKNETGSWRWAGFMAVYTTVLAWVISLLAYQIGLLFV